MTGEDVDDLKALLQSLIDALKNSNLQFIDAHAKSMAALKHDVASFQADVWMRYTPSLIEYI